MVSSESYNEFSYFKIHFPTDSVAHVEINRPDKLNAFSPEMFTEFGEIFEMISHDSALRAIILSGAGDKAFTAGLDIKRDISLLMPAHDIEPARKGWKFRRDVKRLQDAIGSVERCEKPVICVLHGISFGLAIDIATCADIRICSSSTKFSVKEVDIGIAADVGTLSRLPKVVGSQSWVKEIATTARVFGADEALRQGFVSNVFETKSDALTEAVRLSNFIAGKSPIAVQGTKALLNYSMDHTIQEGLDYTQIWNSLAIQAFDPSLAIEGIAHGMKPIFPKL